MRAWIHSASMGLAILSLIGSSALAMESSPKAPPDPVVNPQADNSKVNKRDNTSSSPTADQQSNAKADLELTNKIRRALTSNSTLSTYAQNVKVISRNGHVVLKGPVNSDKEKRLVEEAAITIAGKTQVDSQLEIATK